jgi:hypothetical protein
MGVRWKRDGALCFPVLESHCASFWQHRTENGEFTGGGSLQLYSDASLPWWRAGATVGGLRWGPLRCTALPRLVLGFAATHISTLRAPPSPPVDTPRLRCPNLCAAPPRRICTIISRASPCWWPAPRAPPARP